MYYIGSQGNIYQCPPSDPIVGDRLATQIEVDAHDLAQAKARKIEEIYNACKAAIEADFLVVNSTGAGIDYWYPNKEGHDQTALLGQSTGAIAFPTRIFYLKCRNNVTGVWADIAHTAAQILAVGDVGRVQYETAKIRYTQKYNAIMAATTVAAVNAVIW